MLCSLAIATEPERLTKLRSSYEAAIQRANSPIIKTYISELEKLKIESTKAGRLEDALAIDSEIKKLQGLSNPATEVTLPTTTPASSKKLTKAGLERFLQSTNWIYSSTPDNSDGKGQPLVFGKNGKILLPSNNNEEWPFAVLEGDMIRIWDWKVTIDTTKKSHELNPGDGRVRYLVQDPDQTNKTNK